MRERSLARGNDAPSRTDLAVAAALVERGYRARSVAPRVDRYQPGSHAARIRRADRPVRVAAAAVAHHRGPALERRWHRAVARSHRATTPSGSTDVARDLSAGRAGVRRAPAEGRAP